MNIEQPDSDTPSPSFDVDITLADPNWEHLDFPVREIAELTARETLFCTHFSTSQGTELSILLANDDLIRTLNREYRGKDSPTNVLSFASDETGPGMPLGDIILAYETIKREAEDNLKPIREHFMHLIVHGTLHLLGYDHQEDAEADDMENMEIWILQRLGVKNPYLTETNL